MTTTSFSPLVLGTELNDTLTGTISNDQLIGLEGNDTLDGALGSDVLIGGDGDDTFISDALDFVDGGLGIDTIDFSALTDGLSIDLDLNSPPGSGASEIGAVLTAAPAAGGTPTVAVLDVENVIGTQGNDFIFGNQEVNVLEGGLGNDVFHSFGGADTVDGGDGIDTVLFSAGPGTTVTLDDFGNGVASVGDTLISIENITGSASGDDNITGNAGNNILNGNGGNDTLNGGAGDDILISDGIDTIDGGTGNDTVNFSGSSAGIIVDLDVNSAGGNGTPSQDGGVLDAPPAAGGAVLFEVDDIENVIGTDFNDGIFGNNEVNILIGGLGNDTFHSFGGADIVDGGDGIDTVLFSAGPGVTVTLDDFGDAVASVGDTLISIENITGSASGDDNITGNAGNNILNGNGGNDTLNGGAGDDILISDGIDTIDGGTGTDTVNFSGSSAGIIVDLDVNSAGGNGTPSQDGGVLDAPPAAGGAVLFEVDDVENVIGTDFNDGIFGNNEINVLEGGLGNDTFHSFGGADTVDGGEGIDTVLFSAGPGVTVDLDNAGNAIASVGDSLISIENITGSASGNDDISGNNQANTLNGNGGDDILNGEAGFDLLQGGAGNDTLDGGANADNLFAGTGDDELLGGQGFDRLFGEEGNDNLSGGLNNDALFGQLGNDFLNGDDGNDRLFGGAGFDSLNGGEGNDDLTGNFNADFFVFEDNFGQDTITDFDQANAFEAIDLSAVTAITDFADLLANHLSEIDGNAVITDGANTITLTGVEAADLVAGDFIF